MKSNVQLKYGNYVAFSHFHGKAVNNSGLSSMQYYFKPIREFPAGRGFADFVFIPKPEFQNYYPARVVELKWDKSAKAAVDQIKNRKYPESIACYAGELLLVGINYDEKTKDMNARLKNMRNVEADLKE